MRSVNRRSELMHKIRDLRIGARLALAFLLAALLTALLGAVAYARLSAITTEWQAYESVTLAKLQLLQHSKDVFGDAVHSYKDYVLRGGDYRAKFLANLDEIDQAVRDSSHMGSPGTGAAEAEAEAANALFAATAGYR